MPTLAPPPAPPTLSAWATSRKRWTVDEFHEIYSLPAFEGTRLLLLDGEILDMPNPNAPHDAGLGLALAALIAAFGPGFWVRGQMALRLSQTTDPMPDIADVPGTPRNYPQQPTTALLVSRFRLVAPSTREGRAIRGAGITDYWVVDRSPPADRPSRPTARMRRPRSALRDGGCPRPRPVNRSARPTTIGHCRVRLVALTNHSSTSQITTRPVVPPAAHVRPSGAKASDSTTSIRQENVVTSRPVRASQNFTRSSSPARRNQPAVGAERQSWTVRLWPVRRKPRPGRGIPDDDVSAGGHAGSDPSGDNRPSGRRSRMWPRFSGTSRRRGGTPRTARRI